MSKKLLWGILLAIGILGAVVSVVLLVSAVFFGEWGRVLFYFATAAVCMELSFLSALRFRK